MIVEPKIRRSDIDWLRVLVFGLLILFHVGMVFVPWNYHIKNNELSETFIYPMFFLSQWRLPILFVISGMGTRYALSSRSGSLFVKERFIRLVIPLIFGMLIIVVPQVYYERLAQGQQYSSIFQFYPDYFKGIYPTGNFTWNHLWFLPYLFVYSIILLPLFLYMRNNSNSGFIKFLKLFSNKPLGLYIYVIPLILVVITLRDVFPVTRNLYYDWYAFALYMVFFISGFFLISIKDLFWVNVRRIRVYALILGIISFALVLILQDTFGGTILYKIFLSINSWSWILVIFGYGSEYLNRSSKILSYCNEAVYPFYILHQTVIIFIAYYLRNIELSILSKFILLSILTFLITWIIYEFTIRKNTFIRPLFGLKIKSNYLKK